MSEVQKWLIKYGGRKAKGTQEGVELLAEALMELAVAVAHDQITVSELHTKAEEGIS